MIDFQIMAKNKLFNFFREDDVYTCFGRNKHSFFTSSGDPRVFVCCYIYDFRGVSESSKRLR